jgi:hypothetical protein
MADEEKSLIPSTEAVNIHMLFTIRHSCNVEYFLDKLSIGSNDPQRPHDLVGLGNKFKYSVLEGLSLVHEEREEEDEERYKIRIFQSIEEHRQQYHHQKYNLPGSDDETKPNENATDEDMYVGAVDSVCAMLEGRSFQRAIEDYDDVLRIVRGESDDVRCEPHKRPWIELIAPEMQKIKQPSLEEILAVKQFPNIGLPNEMYDLIRERAKDTAEMLAGKGYKIK